MQVELAKIYLRGICLRRNDWMVRELTLKAAEQGNASAQLQLGQRYSIGSSGFEKDPVLAVFWYRKAAEQGDTSAQHQLGRIYQNGISVERDLEKARAWYQMAAEQGHSIAKIDGEMLECNLDPVDCKKREEAKKKLHAVQAKHRFGLIRLSVTEAEETKRFRAQGPSTADGIAESVGGVAGFTAEGAGVGAFGFGFGLAGPVGIGIGAVLGLMVSTTEAIEEGIPKEEKIEIKAAVKAINMALAEENVEQNTRTHLLALAESQHASGLFVTSPEPEDVVNSTEARLDIEIQNIGVVKVPGNRRVGRLWLMANVKLYGNGVEGGAEDRYFCYGGVRTPDLVEWARDDAKSFREDLNNYFVRFGDNYDGRLSD